MKLPRILTLSIARAIILFGLLLQLSCLKKFDQHIVYLQVPSKLGYAPFFYAIEKGLFNYTDITWKLVDEIPIDAKYYIKADHFSNIVLSILEGKNYKVIYQMSNSDEWGYLVCKEMPTEKTLKNQTLAIPDINSSVHLFTERILYHKWNLKEWNYKIHRIENEDERIRQILDGKIYAAFVENKTTKELSNLGLKIIAKPGELLEVFSNVFSASGALIEEKPDAIRFFKTTLNSIMDDIHKNPSLLKELILKKWKVNTDEADEMIGFILFYSTGSNEQFFSQSKPKSGMNFGTVKQEVESKKFGLLEAGNIILDFYTVRGMVIKAPKPENFFYIKP